MAPRASKYLFTEKDLFAPSQASDPGRVTLSEEYLERLAPDLFKNPLILDGLLNEIRHHLAGGDSRAAMVMKTSPLLVAAYTDELDCVAVLEFPEYLVEEHELEIGSRLLTVNVYFHLTSSGIAPDLSPGSEKYDRFGNFQPYIAEFFSEDIERIGLRKLEISEAEWDKARTMGEAWLADPSKKARCGRPFHSQNPKIEWKVTPHEAKPEFELLPDELQSPGDQGFKLVRKRRRQVPEDSLSHEIAKRIFVLAGFIALGGFLAGQYPGSKVNPGPFYFLAFFVAVIGFGLWSRHRY